MWLFFRSLPILVLIAALFSACTPANFTPPATAQATNKPTSQPAPQVEPTKVVEPTQIVPSATPLPDIVHLGMGWADFSLRFDPGQWEISAFDDHWPGLQVLSHRTLAGCRIIPNVPVGLGEGWTKEVKQITLGQLALEATSFYRNGALKFVTYDGFLNPHNGSVVVHFIDHSEACIQAAEALFAAAEVILPSESITVKPGAHPAEAGRRPIKCSKVQ